MPKGCGANTGKAIFISSPSDREIELYARESDDTQAGEASRRMAVEQLGILRARGQSPRSDRRLELKKREELKSPRFEKAKPGAPALFPSFSPGHLSAGLLQMDSWF